jgi:hypothetical protein
VTKNPLSAQGVGAEIPDISLPTPAEAAPCPPIQPAEQLLKLLGKNPAQTWFRTITPGKGANRSRSGRDLHGFDAAALDADNAAGAAVYFITGDADQAAGAVTDADVQSCQAVFVEWDDRPIEWQMKAWRELGLPEPTAMVQTGGKSVHCYWRLAEPMAPAEWRVLQKQLIDYTGGDTQCKNPSRLMRLPGFRYIDKATGKPTNCRAELIHQAEVRYSAAEIAACIPAPGPQQPAKAHNEDLPPRPEAELLAALERVPEFFHDQGRRQELLGLAQRLTVEWGLERAHQWLAQHSPTIKDLAGYFSSNPDRISAGSIWPFLSEHYGVDLKRHDLKRLDSFQLIDHEPLPASLQALIQKLPKGWTEDSKPQGLTAGRLADMLPGEHFRFDQIDLRAYVETSNGWQRITDEDLDSSYVLLTGMGWKVGLEPVVKAILHVARQTPVHPLRDYLQRIENDPAITPYDLDQVAPKFLRASNRLHVQMVRKWLVGAVNRAMEPGCQMDYVLVLHGDQGLLKSSWFKVMASADWFCSTAPESEKDFQLNVHSCWIFELAELESITGQRQAGRLKNLITTSVDHMRPPYGRTNERLPRSSVFGATCNKDEFLRDDTGNRRFWVVPIEGADKLDIKALKAARDGIWKAAVQAWRQKELPMLPADLEVLSSKQNERFNEHDPWLDMVQAWLDGDPIHRWDPDRDPSTTRYDPDIPFTSAEVLYSAGLKRPDAITRADEMRVAAVLKQLHFKRVKQKRVNGKAARTWQMSQPSQPSQPQAAEVVTPQTATAARDLGLLSQPSQPLEVKGVMSGDDVAAGSNTLLGKRGCDTPAKPVKTTAAQSISVSQPTFSEVVTAAEVVTPPNGSSKRPKPRPALRSTADTCPPELQQQLHDLLQTHPTAHPATLAIKLDPDGSRRLSGRQVKRWLEEGAA